MQGVRVKFKKQGRAKYISHLDLNRAMSRAIKRAEVPFWYTQGFNPHFYITFALPLSIFSESDGEFMDAKLDGEMPFARIKELLSWQMPEGIEICEVYEQVMKPVDIAFAKYRISLEFEGKTQNEINTSLTALQEREEINITKTTKRGSREYDIKEYFNKSNIEIRDGKIIIETILPASPQENLNPSCFSAAFEKYADLKPDYDSIKRIGIYNEKMEQFR